MKTLLLTSALILSGLGVSAAYAETPGNHERLMDVFGPGYTLNMAGHDMTIQAIKDAKGHEWIVMSREDAEVMLGHKFGSDVVFKEYRPRSK